MKDTKISWCHSTFNPWWGCQKVAPECDRCYAEPEAARWFPKSLWGPATTATRKTMGDAYWNEPLRWERAAAKAGSRMRVFSGSMCDVCDNHPIAMQQRPRLISLIERTPHLDWLLLSKRPGNYQKYFWSDCHQWPDNVWVGTSAGTPHSADLFLPKLCEIEAVCRFVSVEPYIERFDITPYLPFLDWVIIGGESDTLGNQSARPLPLSWIHDMVGQCQQAGVAVFVKQMGSVWARQHNSAVTRDHKGGNMETWPTALRVREFPSGLPRVERKRPYYQTREEARR